MGRSKDYDNNMRGALFRVKDKESDKHPDYNGQCEIDGIEYWVSGWINESDKVGKYLSLSFNEKEGKRSSRGSRRGRDGDDRGGRDRGGRRDRDDDRDRDRGSKGGDGGSFKDFEDDIPF